MDRNIKAILVGCGMVGGTVVDWSKDKGVDYIGAFDVVDSIVSKTISERYGFEGCDTKISDIRELENFLSENEVDICIATPTAPTESNLDTFRTVLRHKVNILTSLADTYVMDTHFPEMFAELDALAKENGVSYVMSGIQDVFWTALPVALTGCALDIEEIKGVNVALIDYFGPGVADECYVGWNLEDFNKANESGELVPNDFGVALYELTRKLGLHPTGETSTLQPLLAKEDTYYETIDRHVKTGQLLGNYAETTVTTEEGITFVVNFVSKMSEPGDTDLNSWEIKGNPNINIITERMQGEITTGSNMVNRIPDVINAAPGVIQASDMEVPMFKAGNLNKYVK